MKKKAFIFYVAILISFILIPTTFAQIDTASVRRVRFIETNESGITDPASLSFSFAANTFHVLTGVGSTRTSLANIFLLSPTEDLIGSLRITDLIKVPIYMAFDNADNRLLIFESNSAPMIELKLGSDGNLDLSTLTRHNVQHFGVQNPEGMTVDPDNGHILLLDSIGPRLVRIEPDAYGGFDNAMVSQVDLQSTGLTDPRGIALDPNTGNLHILSPFKQKLYELTQEGQLVTIRDLSELDLSDLWGMVFAPSGDMTDDPVEVSLYIADYGPRALQDHRPSFLKGGRIIELSLIQPAVFKSMAVEPMLLESDTIQGSLVQTIDVSQFYPPSPDPSGIAYINTIDTLLFSDSEVNEMDIFTGDNLFEITLSGNLIDAFTTLSFSTEPTGVAYNMNNEHLFISDDKVRKIFEVDSGPDGYYGTSDDIITSFSTGNFNSNDPEGVAFDSLRGVLFIADGVNNEVYRVSSGANGIFDGSPPGGDDEVNSFDTEIIGITDPEGITFDTDNGLLYIVGYPTNLVAHITTDGTLVRMIDISAANAMKPAGLAYAPSSVNPLAMNIYITERGVDNYSDPNENDGKVYEMSFPLLSGNLPPSVDAGPDNTITLPEDSVFLDGTATDDGNPDPPGALTVTWSQVSGPNTVFFDNDSAENTLAIFPGAGEYLLRLTASDSELISIDETLVTVIDPTAAGTWQFDDGSGTVALDSSGNGNDGMLNGSPVWTFGISGSALDFSGGEDRVLVADSSSLNISGQITIAAWVKPRKTATQYVVKKARINATDGYELSLSANGRVFTRFNQASAGNTYRLDSQGFYPNDGNTWMHIAAIYDGQEIKLYVDGLLEASSNVQGLVIAANSNKLSIGAQDNGLYPFDGVIDQVHIYGYALPATDIQDLIDSEDRGNLTPVAADDAYTTAEDTPLNVAAPGVLGNDSDSDADPLTAVIDTTTSSGSLTFSANGSFSYTPDAGFSGTDSFTYHANDGRDDSNIATVTITVTAVNKIHIGDIGASSYSSGNKKWKAVVNITAHDSNENVVPNAEVSGTWSDNKSSIGLCITNIRGTCSLTSPPILNSDTTVTFNVDNVSYANMPYDPSANHDPDGDSDGSIITVYAP